MKVLRVAHHGVVSDWRERERELRRSGVDVTMLSAHRWNEGGKELTLDAGDDTFVVAARTVGRHPNVFAYDPRPVWRLIGEEWDLIDLHEEPCSLAVAEIRILAWLRRQGAPFLVYSAQNISKRYPIPFRWFERSALRRASGAYVCNEDAAKILRSKGLTGPVPVIGLGIDMAHLSPEDRPNPDPDRVVVGYAGRLDTHKGVFLLPRLLTEHPGWTLRIAGAGPARADLEAEARKHGVFERITYLGHLSGESLAEHFRACDVTVVPSLPTPRWLEQFGRVAVESMACGTPVVASRSGALPEVVGDGGLLVEPGDVGALADAVAELSQSDVWRDRRAKGVRRASAYRWQKVAQQQLRLYRETTGEARGLPDLHVLIVAYGDPALLDDCLAALGNTLPVLVVDNASSRRVRDVARSRGAEYLDAGGNLGFAAGVNLGMKCLEERGSRADVLLVNPDARMDADAARTMQRRAHRGRVAAVGVTQTDPATGYPARVIWPFPSPLGAWIEAVGLGGLRRQRHFVIGSMLLLTRRAWEDVGPMDESFFLYSEETDWQKRARQRGWGIAVVDAPTLHIGAGTGGDPQRREAWFHASLETFIRKHHGRAGWVVFRAAMVAGATLRANVLPGERGVAARRRLWTYLRGPASVGRSLDSRPS